jgi:hypothetical protein
VFCIERDSTSKDLCLHDWQHRPLLRATEDQIDILAGTPSFGQEVLSQVRSPVRLTQRDSHTRVSERSFLILLRGLGGTQR